MRPRNVVAQKNCGQYDDEPLAILEPFKQLGDLRPGLESPILVVVVAPGLAKLVDQSMIR